ncbi:Na+/H+ antiporter subunit D [Chlorobium limicola]|uniref:NADH/ubiquinone/plastoquinone n=1 Tax=Chlorobium limicola TaxID=1092 RepID=A0A101JRJ2_CHLLI|nr:Na+/H+ antiporter subunit D [Chlorobium limicola]KUL31666.1 NADH/ubiquinone/plastoquinone [Chlorobium limicola]
MNQILVFPILFPLLSAITMLFFRRSVAIQRIISILSSFLLLAAAGWLLAAVISGGMLTVQVGGWRAPFGITLAADLLSAVMVAASALIGLTTVLYSLATIDRERERFFYYPLLQFLMMGINGAFLTGDVFNLYVWFEVMLISSFVLLVLGGTPVQLEGAIKYVTINLLSSSVFLAAAGILYGMAGTLNMADLARITPHLPQQNLLTVVSVLFMITFGVKAAVFPLFFWLPASYHTPPVAVSAIFAGLLTKVGVYALIRFFTTIFSHEAVFIDEVLLAASALTMLSGVLGAAAQYDFRRLLSFHIISQIGYMIFGLALHSPLAIAGALFYIVHNIIAKTNLFYISGIVERITGTYDLKKAGGVYAGHPVIGMLFLIPALALAGIPPLSGFWAKFVIIKAGFQAGEYAVTGIALLVGLLTLFSMMKIWNEAFLKDLPQPQVEGNRYETMGFGRRLLFFSPVVVLGLVTVLLGVFFEPVFRLAETAAAQLLDTQAYITPVLGRVK